MERRKVGTVAAIWRYPVKSMQGEKLDEIEVTLRGTVGDRGWALRDLQNNRIASAKKFLGLLKFYAEFEGTPTQESLPPVRIKTPEGRTFHAADPDASKIISQSMQHDFRIEKRPETAREAAGIDPRTVFSDIPFEQVIPGLKADNAPDYFQLAPDSFFDSAQFHVISTGTLAHMRDQTASDFDYRRFRPNVLVETSEGGGFIEDQWTGGVLEIGGMSIAKIVPALRCVMTTAQQQDLPKDPRILRSIVQNHQANLGAFASVNSPGGIRLGDPVYLLK